MGKEIILIIFILLVFIFFATAGGSKAVVKETTKRRSASVSGPAPGRVPSVELAAVDIPPQSGSVKKADEDDQPKIQGFQIDYSSMPQLPRRVNRRGANVKFGSERLVRDFSKKTGQVLGDRVEKV